MARKRVSATVRALHAEGGSTTLRANDEEAVDDVRAVYVTFKGVAWLHGVQVTVDQKTGEIEVTVIPEDENSPTAPRLKVSPNLSITART